MSKVAVSKFAFIGAVAPVVAASLAAMSFAAMVLAAMVLVAGPARADWRVIAGSKPILPTRFVVRQPPRLVAALPDMQDAAPRPGADSPISWIAPLVDRRLSQAQRTADLAPELQDAIMRVEPMYDPTRLEGPQTPVKMSVAAGTASMNNVFADSWDRADPDANVSRRVRYIAMAWQRSGPLPCDDFLKNRARAGYEQPALTALTGTDCKVLLRGETASAEAIAAPVPIVPGWIAVPTFAAPLPGSRLSSEAFWAARRNEVARVEADLHVRQTWHGGMQGVTRTLVSAPVSGLQVSAPVSRTWRGASVRCRSAWPMTLDVGRWTSERRRPPPPCVAWSPPRFAEEDVAGRFELHAPRASVSIVRDRTT